MEDIENFDQLAETNLTFLLPSPQEDDAIPPQVRPGRSVRYIGNANVTEIMVAIGEQRDSTKMYPREVNPLNSNTLTIPVALWLANVNVKLLTLQGT